MDTEFPMRLNKFLAHRGFATRRGADTLIDEGRVFINGKVAALGQKVTEKDLVEIKDYTRANHTYILYYKPRGVITHSPGEGEVDIATRIKRDHSITGVFPIGRLDKESEGLMLLTDDGRVTERVLNPEQGHEREYEVVADKRVTQTFLNGLAKGVRIEGYVTRPAQTKLSRENEFTFTIALTEGKKHQVRRMCAALGYQVVSLKRIRMLDLELKNMKPGGFHRLTKKEIEHFTKSLGLQ